ncbi:two component regulator [Nitzschia inconspicua]|uniref:Two component regulator n=1 Tax=Nitzschia inconspicua TaxID=303405 RepID=A0A9K3PIN6_9STRA|nr:two component regulator [Nitzschia inconspicua]
MAKQGPRPGEIPRQVIPLPDPPSECGSIIMSDGSITASVLLPCDGSVQTDTCSTIDLEKQMFHLRARHSPVPQRIQPPLTTQQPQLSSSSPTTTNPPPLNDRPPSVLKPHRYTASAPATATRPNQTVVPSEDSIPSSKKRVTLVVSPEETRKENDQSTISTSKRSMEEENDETIKNTNRWCCCSSAVIYALFGIAVTITIVAVGVNLLLYFDRQNKAAVSPSQSPPSTIINFTTPSESPVNEPWPEVFEPTNPSNSSVPEGDVAAMIQSIVTDQFRIDLPQDDPLAPTNRAVQWLIEEAEASSSGNTTQVYSTLEKFSQRFAALVLRYALAAPSSSSSSSSSSTIVNATFETIPRRGIDECEWQGITCDDDRMISQIDFSDFALSGTIPNEIKFLQRLTVLDLSNNQLQGSLPNELYDLELMQRVYLYQNRLTGTLSPWIGQWDDLEVLHLSNNRFRGPIPQQLQSDEDRFRPLRYLNLYDNRFTGTIPSNLRWRDLQYLDLGRNVLFGTIPSDIGDTFSSLRWFHIDYNRFSGTIPETIPPMANGRLESFLANHNFLTGRVPDNWVMFNRMFQFKMHENNFDSLGEQNCWFNVFTGGNCVEFTADCAVCTCPDDLFCDRMCAQQE